MSYPIQCRDCGKELRSGCHYCEHAAPSCASCGREVPPTNNAELASLRTRLSAAEGEVRELATKAEGWRVAYEHEREARAAAEGERDRWKRVSEASDDVNAAERARADAAEAGWANERAIWLRVNAAQARSLEEARRVLDDIEAYEIDWTKGTGENVAAVQNMACAALNKPIPIATPSPEGKP